MGGEFEGRAGDSRPRSSPQVNPKFLHQPFHQPIRGGGGQGQDKLGLRDAPLDKAGGLKHGGQVPLDFTGPAAGEQGDGEGLGVQVVPQQKGSPVREGRQGLPEGVAHVIHGHALGPVKVGLKGEDDHQAVGEARQGAHPVGAPGPDLGADVVQHRHPVISGQAGHPKVKVGKIHQDDQVRAGRFQDPADASEGLPDGGQVARDFHEAHHGQLRGGGENPHPLGAHFLTPHPEEPGIGTELPDGRHQPGGVVVTGGLPGDHEDLGGLIPGEKAKGRRPRPQPP